MALCQLYKGIASCHIDKIQPPGPHIVNTSHNTLHLLVVLSGQRRSLHCHNVHDTKILIYVPGPRAQNIKKAILGNHNHREAQKIPSKMAGWGPPLKLNLSAASHVESWASHLTRNLKLGRMEKWRRGEIQFHSPARPRIHPSWSRAELIMRQDITTHFSPACSAVSTKMQYAIKLLK